MKAIKKFFHFSSSENKGILLLSFLFFALLLFRIYLRYSAKDVAVEAPFKITLDNDIPAQDDHLNEEGQMEEMKTVSQKTEINKASQADFEAIGIPVYLAKRIIKYRNTIGNFKSLDQFKKTYGMNENLFQEIYPFIYIEEKSIVKKVPETQTDIFEKEIKNNNKKTRLKTQLNFADSIAIDNTKGISSNFTSKILKYRSRLGGFYSKNQLTEIYYFGHDADSQYYHLITENIDVDENEIVKININNATVETLGKHPYIGFNKARIILAFIKQHDKINSIEELQKIAFISEENIKKLNYYLVFDE